MASDRAVSSASVRFGGDFEFNLRSFELKKSGQVLKLERIPTDLLYLLIQNRGELVTRDQIVEQVWGKDVFLDTDNSINAAIRKIRQVLDDDPAHPRFVQTLTSRGYRFIAAVEESGTTPVAENLPPGGDVDHLLGKRISHYRLIRLLGGGGMGLVFEGEDLKLGRRVAVKLLPTELASEPGAFERFEREARAASSLDHPNICSIYQLGEHEGQPFIVMQLLEGTTLREWIEAGGERGTATRLRELIDYAIQIADGLDAAHQKGIIHRDIKPANIFITRRGQAKILDFGVAKFVEGAEGSPNAQGDGVPTPSEGNPTRTSASLGTPSYLSPEQIRREKLDLRTDLFSFGLVLYEMATSQRAFPGSTTTVIRDAVLQAPTVPLRDLAPDVPPELERVISKALMKDRDQRWQTAREIADELRRIQVASPSAEPAAGRVWPETGALRRHYKKLLAVAALLIAAIATAAGLHYRSLRASHLSEKDSVVLTDFSNNTGDAVFDDTLKQALKVSLSQSPFLNILPDRTVRATLKLMTQPSNTPISPSIAREVCQRSGSKAFISGAIASLDTDYVIGLKAENCLNGTTLAQEQVTAHTKDDVIAQLGLAATNLRARLGESISTVKKFDVPLRRATTGSLEALKEYTLGGQAENAKGPPAAIPHYQKAIALDPLFARAYSALSGEYFDSGQQASAALYSTKAYELRDRVTDLEKVQIESAYHNFATGDLEKSAHAYQRWAQIRPSYAGPHSNLAYIYAQLGWFDKTLAESIEGVRLGESPEAYNNLFSSYVSVDRLEEAKATFARIVSRGLDNPYNHPSRYMVAFLEQDRAGMDRELAYGRENKEVESWILYFESGTHSYYGQQAKARQFLTLASASALAQNQKETAVSYAAEAALREALFGNTALARQTIQKALTNSVGQDVQAAAALTYAFTGERQKAQSLADAMAKQFPQNTLVQFNYLPAIRARIALDAGHPDEALELLKPARPYELGQPAQIMLMNLYPVYIRGEACLAAHDNKSAIGEFQEILEHPGMSLNEPIAALAHLGIARAFAAQADKDRARSAYQDFLSLWKDADPGIPILKQARAEYASLQ